MMITSSMSEMFASYDEALRAGRLDEAFQIAYANRDDFDWEGEYPEDWTEHQITEHGGYR